VRISSSTLVLSCHDIFNWVSSASEMELERTVKQGDETRGRNGPEEIVFSYGNLESLHDVADAVGSAYELAIFENEMQLVLGRVRLCKGALDDVEESAGVCEAD
jgi:hypothetical protein